MINEREGIYMKRLSLILLAVCLFSARPASSQAATASISNNGFNFGIGDTLQTTVALTNSGSPVNVDVYLALILPDQTLIFFDYNNGLVPHIATSNPSTWVKLASDMTLSNGLDTGPIPLFSYTLTGNEEPGTYEWAVALTAAGTLNVIDLKTAPFFVSNGPVGELIGTYDVTTAIPSLGASGTAVLKVTDSSPGVLTFSATGSSAGYTSTFTGTGLLDNQGGISLTTQADIFGTQVQGSGYLSANGNITGTINVLAVGPFIQSITNISGTFSNGIINTTETVHYTDNTSGTEYFQAIRR